MNFLGSEVCFVKELFKFEFGIGPLEQHEPKCAFGQERVHAAKMHLVDRLVDRLTRSVSAKIDDQSATPGGKYALHFLKRAQRLREILKRRAAQHKIERCVR